jgi:hypothetical protein
MALMTVNNHNEQGKDHRSQPRWSAADAWSGPGVGSVQLAPVLVEGDDDLALGLVDEPAEGTPRPRARDG